MHGIGGDVWVGFLELDAATICQRSFHGRWYGGQMVLAEFSDEAAWMAMRARDIDVAAWMAVRPLGVDASLDAR